MFVQLKPGWPGSFRRTVRDAKKQVVRVLEFQPGQPPQEITGELELAAIKVDLGNALVEKPPPITKVEPAELTEKPAATLPRTAAATQRRGSGLEAVTSKDMTSGQDAG